MSARKNFSGTHALLRLDPRGTIVRTSKRAKEILRFSRKALLGSSLWDVIPPDLASQLQHEMEIAAAQQSHLCHETFDARIGAWLEYHACPIDNGFILLILDVTTRQRSELARQSAQSNRERELEQQIRAEAQEKDSLKRIQQRLRMALTAARMATWEYGLIAGEFSFSDNVQDVLGVPLERAPRTPLDMPNWLVPEDYVAHIARVEAAVNSGEEFLSEFRLRNPETSEIRWMESRGITQKDDEGRPVFMYGTIQDITQRKNIQDNLERCVDERTAELNAANRVLREAEQRVNLALRNAPIAMSVVDRDLRYKWFHHPLIRDSEKYIGRAAESFLNPHDAAELSALRRQVMDGGIGLRKEVWLTVAGREICYDMMLEPLRNEKEEIEGVTAVALDITERKRSEEKLRKMNVALQNRADQLRYLTRELTRAEERERRRIAQMLHDHLQQLLVGAKFSLEAISSRTNDERMVSGLSKICELLDQSIAASRSLTAELVPPMLYEKGLPDALRWLVRWMQEKLGIEVTLEADERKEELAQDLRVLLFQSIRELLFNVAKHAQVKRAMVTLCYGDDNMVAARVRDEGIGFDPLTQEAVEARVSGGFGLIALRERLATVGGELEIKSAPGQGTMSTIRMPVRFEETLPVQDVISVGGTLSKGSARPKTASDRCNVLVADDHPIIREGITRLLKESPGIDVIGEAEDGWKAVELAKSLRPDVVLMDVNMPNMNGIEATRIIHRELPEVRVVGLSMYDPSEAAKAMREAGASAFLAKDAPVADLLAAIYPGA